MYQSKTKIITTIGPASKSKAVMKRLVKAGANLFRINFSHITKKELSETLKATRAIEKELGITIPIIADLQGPKIRLNKFKEEIRIKKGQIIELGVCKDINDNPESPSIVYPKLLKEIKRKDRIFIDDGLIEIHIEKITKTSIIGKVLSGKFLKPRKGVNLPDTHLKVPALTKKDLNDIKVIAKEDFDFIALSFVRTEQDVIKLKNILKELNPSIKVISKIEKPKAIERLDEIIQVSDGILVARGDLGVEISLEKVPAMQDIMVKRCKRFKKPIIIATQMLESMTNNARPTRAEVTDVYHAVRTATDAVMLSGETAAGKHPVEAVKTMMKIIKQAEKDIPQISNIKINIAENIDESVAFMGSQLTEQLNAKYICVFTYSGLSARLVSKSLLHHSIIAFCMSKKIERQVKLFRGVNLTYTEKRTTNLDELFKYANDTLLREKIVKKGDKIVIVTGQPLGYSGSTNILKIHTIS